MLGLLDQALRDLPDEIREARWALRDREELMAAEIAKAAQLMDQVRAEAARMVDKTEIVRQSRLAADQIVADAQARARAMVNQAEDFIDGKLGNFEIVLERLLRTARSGRERLSAQGLPTSLIEPEEDAEAPGAAFDEPRAEPGVNDSFFDQDASSRCDLALPGVGGAAAPRGALDPARRLRGALRRRPRVRPARPGRDRRLPRGGRRGRPDAAELLGRGAPRRARWPRPGTGSAGAARRRCWA